MYETELLSNCTLKNLHVNSVTNNLVLIMSNVPSSEIASSRLSTSGTRNKIIESPFLSSIHTIFKNIFALYNGSQHNDNIQDKISDKSTQGNSTNISRCKCHTSLL